MRLPERWKSYRCRVSYDLSKCAADQIVAEITASKIAYLRQYLIDTGFPVAVWPSRNFMSRNLTIIIAATAPQNIISEVRVELLLLMVILAADISNATLPQSIQKGLAKKANIPLCLSNEWLLGAGIIRLLKKSFNMIHLGGGPTTPILPMGLM